MHKHIECILEAVAEDTDGISNTPADNHMFTVREYGYTLTGMQADLL